MSYERVPLDQIQISRERYREVTSDLSGLVESLKKFGQLQPIILDANGELVDGLHRITAAREAGWTEIDAVRQGEISILLAREIELEVNIQRTDMTWQERAKALADLDNLKRAQDPNWTQSATVALANVRPAEVSEAHKLVKMMELFPEIAKNAKNHTQAVSMANTKAKQILRKDAVKNTPLDFADLEKKIILGDSVEVIKRVPDNSFHAIITDPPFGIDYDKRRENDTASMNSYKDDAENYRRLLTMAPDLYRVLKPDGWLIWFFGISWYSEVKEAFRDAGFTVDEIPVVWDRTEGRTFTLRPDRYFARGYDVAIHAFKGTPQIVQRGKPNVLRIPPVGASELMVERPVELYAELIRRLTVPGEIVADFFVGSGSCPAAAASTGRDFFGVEMNSERRAHALQKIKSYTNPEE
jgi:site-specific DNA-methyltransferase (adenine-specific)